MPDQGSNAAKLESLMEALASARGAIGASKLSSSDRQHVLLQFSIIERISRVSIPDWSHIHSLITRLNHRLGDQAPAMTEPLKAWALENAPFKVSKRP